ncbi:MAG: hypothetical protein ACI8RD_006329 [Bacillariaceae sp.]|jgi:hypothetical protein
MNDKNKRFIPFFKISSWWKRRRFQYLVHFDTQDEQSTKERRVEIEIGDSTTEEVFDPPIELYFNEQKSTENNTFSFVSSTPTDSFQDSIESMDSVVDSHYLHPEDECSQPVAFATNVHLDPFLMAHLNFLSQSTQPQEVELVYRES